MTLHANLCTPMPVGEDDEEEEEEEDDDARDPDWPYTIAKAEEIFKVRHFPTLQEAADELQELLHASGTHKGKFNKAKLTQRLIMIKFPVEGWWAG